MPNLTVKVSGARSPELTSQISALLLDLTSRILKKKREVTSTAIDYIDPDNWIVGQKSLSVQRNIATLNLTERNNVSLHNARDVIIKCVEGIVWLTFDDLEGDFILKKGEQIKIESNGLTLMQALPFAKVKLT